MKKQMSTKAFRGQKKLLWSIFAVAFFTSVILQTIMTFIVALTQKQSNAINGDYGKYDVMIVGDFTQSASSLARQMNADDSLVVTYNEFADEAGRSQLYAAREAVLSFLPYRMYEGHFPSSENEILVEAWWLRKYGIETDDMIGCTIPIGDKTFTVSGLIFYTGRSVRYDNTTTIITAEKKHKNAIMFAIEGTQNESDLERYEKLLVNLLGDDVSIRLNLEKTWALEGYSGTDYLLLLLVSFIISGASLLIIYSASMFYAVKCGEIAHIMTDIGIQERRVRTAMFRVIAEQTALGNWVGCFVSVLWNRILFSWTFNEDHGWFCFVIEELLVFLLTLMIQVLAEYVAVSRRIHNSFSKQYARVHVSHKKSFLKRPYFTLALRNIRNGGISIALFVVGYVATASAVLAFSTYATCLKAARVDYSGVSYRLTLKDYDSRDESKMNTIDSTIQRLLEDKYIQAEDCTLYFTELFICKEILTLEMKEFISKYGRGKFALANSLTQKVSIPVALTTIEAAEMEGITISDDADGILINRLNCRDEIIPILGSVDFFEGTLSDRNNIQCEVRDGLIKNWYDNSAVIIIALKKDSLANVLGEQHPNVLYCKGDVSINYLLSVIGDNDMFLVETGEELLQLNADGLNTILWILRILMFVCGASLIASHFAVSQIRIIMRSEEHMTLGAIGIPQTKIQRIPTYENGLICLIICVLTLLVSMGLHVYISSGVSRTYQLIRVPYPWSEFLTICIPLAIAMVLIQKIQSSLYDTKISENWQKL